MDESANQNTNDNPQNAAPMSDMPVNDAQTDAQPNDAPVDGGQAGDDNANGLTAEQQQALEQMSDEQLLDAFAEQMMVDKGLKDQLDEATFNSLKDDLKQRVAFQVNRAILAQLPDDKLEEVGKKMDDGSLSAEDMDKFIDDAKIDVQQTTEEVMLTFRDAYLGAEAK